MVDAQDRVAAGAPMRATKTCFVVMPMSDEDGYPVGHWDRVYNELHYPSCERAGFLAERADSSKGTALIMAEVLRRLHRAEMVLCDVSALRPNVLFELGLRQAFDQPVVLTRDERTIRPFDIAQLRDVEYESSLRVDLVRTTIDNVAAALKETYEKRTTGEYSLVRLIGLDPAAQPRAADADAVQRSLVSALDRLTTEVAQLKRQWELQSWFSSAGVSPVPGASGGLLGQLPTLGLLAQGHVGQQGKAASSPTTGGAPPGRQSGKTPPST